MGRPTQYPRQATVQLTDDQADRIDTDAALRGDGSKSAAHRRLLALGILLADHVNLKLERRGDVAELIARAEKVSAR